MRNIRSDWKNTEKTTDTMHSAETVMTGDMVWKTHMENKYKSARCSPCSFDTAAGPYAVNILRGRGLTCLT